MLFDNRRYHSRERELDTLVFILWLDCGGAEFNG